MTTKNYDIDTIDAIIKLVELCIEDYKELADMWFEDASERDTIKDNDALEWQMWKRNCNKVDALQEIKERLEELKTAEIFRRANVVYVHH